MHPLLTFNCLFAIGVVIGYIVYLTINLFSGDLFDNSRELLKEYIPCMDGVFERVLQTFPMISKNYQLSISHSSQPATVTDNHTSVNTNLSATILPPLRIVPIERRGSAQFALSDDAHNDLTSTPPHSIPPTVASNTNISSHKLEVDSVAANLDSGEGEGLSLNPMLPATSNSNRNDNTEWGGNL